MPPSCSNLIEKERITQIFGLPMMYRAMLDHPAIETTRPEQPAPCAVRDGADAAGDAWSAAWSVFGCGFYLLFGQTEMSPTATIFRPENQLSHPGAAGTPVVNVQVAIMDEDGSLLPQGETGEIVYRGPHTMTEYLHNEDATRSAFADGWFHSGDIGHLGPDGILWFTDRRKDVVKTGGENVSSIEVEKVDLRGRARRRRRRRRWAAASALERSPHRLRYGTGRRSASAGRHPGTNARPHRRIQDSQGDRDHRFGASHIHGEGAEEPNPGAVCDVLQRGKRLGLAGSPRRRACAMSFHCAT